MFLKSLEIINTRKSEIIRDIQFVRGLNLIIDETPETIDLRNTSNNIGKTTVIRLIDFCLGADPKNIYQDPEFKNRSNEKVKDFLEQQEVLIILTLELDDKNIIIERNFLSRSKKILRINGENIQSQNLDFELKKQIFDFTKAKPTFKQIKAKNVRDDAERLSYTVKVLGSFGKDAEYEALYLFWLGVPYESADRKRELLENQKLEQKIYDRIIVNGNESKLNQFIEILNRQIKELEIKKDNFNINENYKKDLQQLDTIKNDLNAKNSLIGRLSLRKELIIESQQSLEQERTNINVKVLEQLYNRANSLLPNLQKSFEETVQFHNQMVEEKVNYITKELPELTEKIRILDIEINNLLAAEKEFSEKLQKAGAIEELQIIIDELNQLYENKGKYTEQLSKLEDSKQKLSEIEEELTAIDDNIENLDANIQEKVRLFNNEFADISQKLYGETFALSASFEKQRRTNSKFYKLSVDSLNPRAGTGKKKGEILAFDLAYIKFADQQNIKCLHFVLHDQMETVDNNQIITFLQEVSNANCQLITPVLRDKMPAELRTGAYEILSLSQDNKLFKI
jgi:uncharacterized protein YydD (DUF2326 family)